MGDMGTDEVIGGLEEVWSSLLEATDELEPTQWALPTACPGWDVKDNLSHLIGIERSLAGDSPPAVELGEVAHVRNAVGEMNEQWVASRRGVSGDEVRAEFAEVTTSRLATLRSLSEEQLDEIGWSPIGQVPMRKFMEVRIMDSWMHEQDIREAIGRPGGRDGIGERVTLGRADIALGPVIGKGAKAPEGSTVAIVITGPLGGSRRLAIVEGRARFEEGDDATVTITMTQATYLRRFGGRISAAEALGADGTSIEGDRALGERIIESLGVMI